MIKQNENIRKISPTNIKLIKLESKQYLYSSPYENVVKVLNALKDYLSTIGNKNNNKALEELEWVIYIISNNFLYNFQKTMFYKNNIDIINGSHKIMDFSNEVEKYNKENADLYKKYMQLYLKNDEFSKSLNFVAKNIPLLNNPRIGINEGLDFEGKYRAVEIPDNKKNINKRLLAHLPIRLLNDNNKEAYENNIINSSKNKFKTDFKGIRSKNNTNNISSNTVISNSNKMIISSKKNKIKELSIDSQSSKNSTNKNQIFNNYKISCTANNAKNKINLSFPKQPKINIKPFAENNILNNNNNQQLEKIISLPIIQFNFNGGINIDKYKINLFNKKNKSNIKSTKKEEEQNNKKEGEQSNQKEGEHTNKKFVTFGPEITDKIPKLPLHLTNGIDINSLFDYQNFDIFILKEKLGLENVMPFLGKEIIKKMNIMHFLDESKIDNFLMVLSKTYQNTRALYHTSLHGVDVCYSTYLILINLREKDNVIPGISEMDIVSLLISGLAHDVGHPGLTNKFMINSKNELSIIYNDASVLENFHCAKTFQLLTNNDINIFCKYSNEDFLSLRKKMIGEILATDMAFHFKIVDQYKEYKQTRDVKLEQLQLNFITHIADLFHNYRKFEISLKWVEVLSNEFWNQGDKEKELGLPVSFLCDREDMDVPKSQVGFLNTFSLPTIQELVDINSNFEQFKNNALNNLKRWEQLQKNKRKRGWSPEKKDEK